MTTREEQMLETYNDQFLRRLNYIVESLRCHADQVDRFRAAYEKDPVINILTGEHEAVDTARRVLAEVLWMVPNLGMDALPEQAAVIDRMYRTIICPTCGASITTFVDGDCPECNPPVNTEV